MRYSDLTMTQMRITDLQFDVTVRIVGILSILVSKNNNVYQKLLHLVLTVLIDYSIIIFIRTLGQNAIFQE